MNTGKLGLLSVVLMFGLTACPAIIDPPGSNGPTISDFSADPEVIEAGDSSTLSWIVGSTATSIEISPEPGDVTGETSATVTPSDTTVYTLTATDSSGNESTETTTVMIEGTGTGGGNSGGPTIPGTGESPDGTFGVSTSENGTFTSDEGDNIADDDDPRIITVAPGDTFYAQVAYGASSTISNVEILLVNSTPADLSGTLSPDAPVGGFTLGEPTGDCNVGTAATITCVYPITVGADVLDIEQLPGSGDEFAYVFRTEVTDAEGNVSDISTRGYVNVE